MYGSFVRSTALLLTAHGSFESLLYYTRAPGFAFEVKDMSLSTHLESVTFDYIIVQKSRGCEATVRVSWPNSAVRAVPFEPCLRLRVTDFLNMECQ